MHRMIAVLALTAVVACSASARTLEFIEGSYEAVLADVTFPASAAGTLTVRICSNCNTYSLPVDSNTRYFGAAGELSLDDLLAEVAALRASGSGNQFTLVGVFYDLDTNRVTRVSLHPR